MLCYLKTFLISVFPCWKSLSKSSLTINELKLFCFYLKHIQSMFMRCICLHCLFCVFLFCSLDLPFFILYVYIHNEKNIYLYILLKHGERKRAVVPPLPSRWAGPRFIQPQDLGGWSSQQCGSMIRALAPATKLPLPTPGRILPS